MSDELPNVFQAASDFLRSSSGHQARCAAPVEQLLLRLGYDRNVAAAVPSRAELENRIALLATVSKFHEVFELAAPDAPGLTCFGGILRPRGRGVGMLPHIGNRNGVRRRLGF